jgi:hypothetical protein
MKGLNIKAAGVFCVITAMAIQKSKESKNIILRLQYFSSEESYNKKEAALQNSPKTHWVVSMQQMILSASLDTDISESMAIALLKSKFMTSTKEGGMGFEEVEIVK